MKKFPKYEYSMIGKEKSLSRRLKGYQLLLSHAQYTTIFPKNEAKSLLHGTLVNKGISPSYFGLL